jgi:outer membrane immunogenic protein
MKKVLLSSVALLGLTVGASAADLPRRAAPPVFTPVPVFTWTGFYVGVNAGAAFRDSEDEFNNTIFFPAGSVVNSPGTAGTLTFNNTGFFNDEDEDVGFTGGGQVGFNYQIGTFVIGIEADLQYIDLNNNDRNNGFGFGPTTYTFVGTPGLAFAPPAANVVRTGGLRGLEYFGTVRGRLGVAFDRAMIYATGGFAYGGGGNDNNFCGGFAGAGFGFGCDDGDDWRGGWTVGGGIEYAFTNNVSVKLEGLYVNLDQENNRNSASVFVPATNTLFVGNQGRGNDENDFFVIRAGVNFRFGTF